MTLTSPIVVAIVHQDPFARACIAATLGAHPDIVVHEGHGADDLKRVVPDMQSCVIVADFVSGLRLAASAPASIGRQQASRAIVIVSDTDREWELRHALARQVRGFLAPGFSLDQLAESVRAVHRGARYLCARAAARLAESMSFEPLTDREREVLALVVEGLCNKSISKTLSISNGTVKSHLKSTYAKLSVISRTQAIAVAERRGLLERRQVIDVRHEDHLRPVPPSLHVQRASSVHQLNSAVQH